MATRIYLPSTGASAVTTTFDASWEQSGSAVRRACSTSKISSAMADHTLPEDATSGHDHIAVQFCTSDQFSGTGTTSGTIKGQIRCSTGTANHTSQLVVRIVSSDGTTVRGTVFPEDATGGTTWAGSLTGRNFPKDGSSSVSAVNWQDGDRILIEVGGKTGTGGESAGTLNFGDDAASDLAEGEADTGADNPWIEFSQDLFAPAGPTTNTQIPIASLFLIHVAS